jgi:uncharacterized protein
MESGEEQRDDGLMTDPNTTSQEVPSPIVPSPDQRNRAMASHLSALVMFVGIPSVLGPLVAWLVWKDDPFVERQAKEALNFNLSFLIYATVAAFSILVLVGFILLPAVLIAWFVMVIDASVKASKGTEYRYPLTIRFVQ